MNEVDVPEATGCTADSGATATEYALMVALITLIIFASVALFGQNVANLFSNSNGSLPFN